MSSTIEGLPTGWPAPLAEEAFSGLAGDAVKVIEPHSEADPVALLVNLLIGFGNMVGRASHFVAEADRHGTNLFAVLVGETSKARKGASWGQVRRLLFLADQHWVQHCVSEGNLSSGEGLIWAVRDPLKGRRGESDDPGVADKRLLVIESEFAAALKVMRREGNILSPVVRQAWDSGNLAVLTKHSPAKATDAHISIIGHVTKGELLRHLDETELGNGFANRFIFASVRRSKYLPEGGDLQESDLDSMAIRLAGAAAFAAHAGEMQRDSQARELWRAVYPSLSEGKPGLLGAITSRAEAQVMRLALIYALLDCSNAINVGHLLAALALWDYSEASANYIFGDATGDPVGDTILRGLAKAPEGLTRTAISSLFAGHETTSRITHSLDRLEALGKARRTHEATKGRSVERWHIEPETHISQNPHDEGVR